MQQRYMIYFFHKKMSYDENTRFSDNGMHYPHINHFS